MCVTDNDSKCKEREEAILLLIAELMTHYAPVDMQHDRLMRAHTQRHTHASVLPQCGRLLCKELDSEIGG